MISWRSLWITLGLVITNRKYYKNAQHDLQLACPGPPCPVLEGGRSGDGVFPVLGNVNSFLRLFLMIDWLIILGFSFNFSYSFIFYFYLLLLLLLLSLGG